MTKLLAALPALAAAVAGRALDIGGLTFIASIVAIVPLAGLIGRATEDLASHIGPRAGGFLNATLGNAAELIIGVFLVAAGEVDVLKASLAGSVIGNVLLVLGLSLLVGGLRHGEQSFDARPAGLHSAALLVAIVGLLMPALFHRAAPEARFVETESVSLGVALVLLIAYAAVLVFSFTQGDQPASAHPPLEARWSKRQAMALLAGATSLVAVASEMLVHSLESAATGFGLSEAFVGLILVPVVGNAAEHSSAVMLAARNRADIAIEIAAGSGTQIALFVAPVLVFVSLAFGRPMDFFFSTFEVAAVGLSAIILGFISLDGRSNWVEGVLLLAAYSIMGVSFFFIPASA